jgi:hypothetical protein
MAYVAKIRSWNQFEVRNTETNRLRYITGIASGPAESVDVQGDEVMVTSQSGRSSVYDAKTGQFKTFA